MAVQCFEAVACLPLVLTVLKAVRLEQERNGLMAVRRRSEAGTVMLHAVQALVMVARNQ